MNKNNIGIKFNLIDYIDGSQCRMSSGFESLTTQTDVSVSSRDIFSIKREPKLYSYVNYLDMYRHDMYYHATFIVTTMIIYSTLGSGIDGLYRWISCISMMMGLIYTVMSGVYIFKVIHSWEKSIKNGLLTFWNLCTELSIKNYRLMREYKEVYQYHYGDVTARCGEKMSEKRFVSTGGKHTILDNDDRNAEIKKYVDYVMRNDPSEKMETYDWIRISVERVNQYIKLCYYLSFVEPSDTLELRQDNIYVNVGTQSALNKRNRKLEMIMNEIAIDYKHELVSAWINLDKRHSDKMLMIIPCKWIIYEYREMFRYLHCAKYFKNIYSSFDRDYTDIEILVHKLCTVLQDIFRRDTIYLPESFLSLFNMLTDTLLLVLDNFIAINTLHCFFTSGSVIIPVLVSCLMHVIVYCVVLGISKSIDEIKNPLKECVDLESIDHKIETIFNEMKVVMFDGKIKRAFL